MKQILYLYCPLYLAGGADIFTMALVVSVAVAVPVILVLIVVVILQNR